MAHTKIVRIIILPPSLESPPEEPQLPPVYGEPGYGIPPEKKSKKRLFIIVGGVIAVLVVLGAAWKLIPSKDQLDNPTPQTSQDTQKQTTTSRNEDVPESTKTKDYSNGFLGLKLKYADTWTVSEAENGVRLESPTFTYTSQNKGAVSGNFRVYIRKGARQQDGKYIGRGYAIQPSEKLAYSEPAPGQLAETNLTLFGLDEPTDFGFFMIAGNYSLQKGDTLGPDYGKEQETYIIAGGFSDPSLTDDLATNTVDPNVLPTSRAYKQGLDIVKSLSLR